MLSLGIEPMILALLASHALLFELQESSYKAISHIRLNIYNISLHKTNIVLEEEEKKKDVMITLNAWNTT